MKEGLLLKTGVQDQVVGVYAMNPRVKNACQEDAKLITVTSILEIIVPAQIFAVILVKNTQETWKD